MRAAEAGFARAYERSSAAYGMRRLGDNFSTLTAPFVIVLTFGQTLGSLLDLECPWPWPCEPGVRAAAAA